MRQWVTPLSASQILQSRWLQLVASAAIGLLFFVLASWGLQQPAVGPSEMDDRTLSRGPLSPSTESLAAQIPADRVAISTPVYAAQSLLADVQVGDRMDIVALLPSRANLPAQSAVAVRGATVVARPPASGGASVVFAVTPEESLVVAHLVQSGVPLTYALWSRSG